MDQRAEVIDVTRRSERDGPDVRNWDGAVASANDLDEQQRHVVWGVGVAPRGLPRAEGDQSLAEAFARAQDPEWADLPESERWAVLVEGDEEEVEAVLVDAGTVRGRAPYLAPGRTDEAAGGYMRNKLRNDVGPRRKVDQPRPS